MMANAVKSDSKSIIASHTRMRSFRVSEALDELIQKECERTHTQFSAFMRDAALDAMSSRTKSDGEAIHLFKSISN